MRGRGCSWLPENRLKTSLFERIIVLSEENQKKLLDLNLSEKELVKALIDGDVKFTKSKKIILLKSTILTAKQNQVSYFHAKQQCLKKVLSQKLFF